MDACIFGENSKRQRVLEGESDNENEDRITNLPESILHYILSLLPTKYAVATCVLSTRWKYLWTSVHNLNFNDELMYSYEKRSINHWKTNMTFSAFVDRVLRLNDVSNIHKFSLDCRRLYDIAHVNEWISTAVKRKVKELILKFTNKDFYVLPDCLLTCESLELLKINIFRKSASINLPASISFPNLKVLHLYCIPFSSREQLIQDVSLCFPLLEELFMDHCKWLEMKTVNISAPALQRLTIYDGLSTGINDCQIRICAESIISLRFGCFHSCNYSLYNLSSLVNAYLDVSSYGHSVHRLGLFLREVSCVRNLELTADSTEAFSTHLFPLTHLTHLCVFNTEANSANSISCRRLVDVLSNMPNMEYLHFPGGLRTFIFKGQSQMIGTTPPCFLSHLKVVDLPIFREKELCFVKFLMKSARVVDKLTIKVGKCKERVTMQLEKLARNSNCVVEFSSEDK